MLILNRLQLICVSLFPVVFQLHIHCARHTFGTYALANGVSMESVAKMLGHSDTKMTRHYARVLDSTVLKEMSVIGGNLVVNNPQTSPAL